MKNLFCLFLVVPFSVEASRRRTIRGSKNDQIRSIPYNEGSEKGRRKLQFEEGNVFALLKMPPETEDPCGKGKGPLKDKAAKTVKLGRKGKAAVPGVDILCEPKLHQPKLPWPKLPPPKLPSPKLPPPKLPPSNSLSIAPVPSPFIAPAYFATSKPTTFSVSDVIGSPVDSPTESTSEFQTYFPTFDPTAFPTGTRESPVAFPTVPGSLFQSDLPTSKPAAFPTSDEEEPPVGVPSESGSLAQGNPTAGTPISIPTDDLPGPPVGVPTQVPPQMDTEYPTPIPTLFPTNSGHIPSESGSHVLSRFPVAQPIAQPELFSPPPVMNPSKSGSVTQGNPTAETPIFTPTDDLSGPDLGFPTQIPPLMDTEYPTSTPTLFPTNSRHIPSESGSHVLSRVPVAQPIAQPVLFSPTSDQAGSPALSPNDWSTQVETDFPTAKPTAFPTFAPTGFPTAAPTPKPSISPTAFPTWSPTNFPTGEPSAPPSEVPSRLPSSAPSDLPSLYPSNMPTNSPSIVPSDFPSDLPSVFPSTSFAPSEIRFENTLVAPNGSPIPFPPTESDSETSGSGISGSGTSGSGTDGTDTGESSTSGSGTGGTGAGGTGAGGTGAGGTGAGDSNSGEDGNDSSGSGTTGDGSGTTDEDGRDSTSIISETGGGIISTCKNGGPSSDTGSTLVTYTFQYVMVINPDVGNDPAIVATNIEPMLHEKIARAFLTCDFGEKPRRFLQTAEGAFTMISLNSLPVDKISSDVCSDGETETGSDCHVVDASFSATMFVESTPQRLILIFGELLRSLMSTGALNDADRSIEKLVFRGFFGDQIVFGPVPDVTENNDSETDAATDGNSTVINTGGIIGASAVVLAAIALAIIAVIFVIKQKKVEQSEYAKQLRLDDSSSSDSIDGADTASFGKSETSPARVVGYDVDDHSDSSYAIAAYAERAEVESHDVKKCVSSTCQICQELKLQKPTFVPIETMEKQTRDDLGPEFLPEENQRRYKPADDSVDL